MSSTYTKHYQDSLDRKTENNDVVRRLLIVDNNLANISQGVNALGTSNVGNAIAALDVQVGLIPRTNYSSNFLAVGNQLTRIENTANAIPTYNASNGVAQLIGGQSNQAIIIGGISSDTQAIRNNDIPRLATGNQVNALSSSIASGRNESNAIPRNTYNAQLDATQATGNATRTESQNIPRVTYNTQLANIQTGVNNIPVQTYSVALGNIQTTSDNVLINTNNIPRASYSNQLNAIQDTSNTSNFGISNVRSEQSGRFNSVDSNLSTLLSQVSGLTGSSGTASSVVNLNNTTLIVPYSVNSYARDLIYALGATETGYAPMSPTTVEIIANSTGLGDANNLINKNVNGWYSTNVSGRNLTLDFGKNKNTRTIAINGLGFKSQNVGSPVNLLISGSNDGTNFNDIQTWSGLGITGIGQWKFIVFSNSIIYRYIRIAMIGFNTAGTNQFGSLALLFYGTINNP